MVSYSSSKDQEDLQFWLLHLTMWRGEETPCCEVRADQLGGKLSHVTYKNAEFAEFSTRICIAIHTKSKLLRNLVNGTRWANNSFALSSWTWWKNNSDLVNTLLLSDQAPFYVSGCVNKHNCRYWAPNNPHELHQHPLHSAKVTVCCAVSWHGVIGPYFFENAEGRTVAVNAKRYEVKLETFLRSEFHPHQQDVLWFQQDESTAHTTQISMQILRTIFLVRFISRSGDITWPTRSPDLAVPHYFLWGYVTSTVYETRHANIADLKQQILESIQGISK